MNHHGDRALAAVIFDMDNTLLDFVAAQRAACRAVLGHLMLPHDADHLFSYFRRPVHGFESHGNIRDFLADIGIVTTGRVFAECCAIYDTKKTAAVMPYPGIPEVLEHLCGQGLVLSVVTDAPAVNAVRRLTRAVLSPYFSAVISPDLSGAAKPDPASFLLALDRLGVRPEEAVLVGDSIRRDIAPAQQLGMITIHARYGDGPFSAGDSSCEPDYVAGEPGEIRAILGRLLTAPRGSLRPPRPARR